jgi:predicted transcriptional regulator
MELNDRFSGRVTSQPLMLEQRKQEAIRLLLEGANLREIAALLGVTRESVRNYLQEPALRAQLQELNAGLLKNIDQELLENYRSKTEILDEIAMLALGEMKAMISDRSLHPSTRAKLIDSALDRTPEISRTKKIDVTQRVLQLKAEDLLEAANAAVEIEARRELKEVGPSDSAADPNSQQNMVRD